jgi:hypothetical protein
VDQPHNDSGKHRAGRIVFALSHVWFILVNAYGAVDAAQRRNGAASPLWGFSESMIRTTQLTSTLEVIGRLGFIAVGIYLLGLFMRRDERAPRYYVRYGVTFLVFEAIVRSQYFWWEPRVIDSYFITFWSKTILYAALIVAALVYVSRHGPTRRTLVQEARAAYGAPPRWVELSAWTLVAWPFVSTLFIDTTTLLSGLISPKAVTEGESPANVILGVSVACGLFILMKRVWRLNVWWIAGILPASLWALSFVYGAMWFLLHWGS